MKKIFLTRMVNDHDFLDVTEDLDTRDSANHIGRTRPSTTISNDKCLIMAQLEEMVGATSGVAASDDTDPRAGAHGRVLVLEHILHIVLIGSLEVVSDIWVEFIVSQCFRHGVLLEDLLKEFDC